MSSPRLATLANVLVALYALDAGLSLFEEALRAATGSTALLLPREIVATTNVLLAVPCLALLLLTPRWPASLFLPLGLSTLWLALGAAPIPLWVTPARAIGPTLAALQVAIAMAVLLRVRQLNDHRGWRLRADALTAPAFSPLYSAGAAAVAFFVGLPLVCAYALVALATQLEVATQGFVQFDLSGVSLADRVYARDDREVRLVGMMHLGEGDAYRELVASFAAPSTVILEEGVTDRDGLLEVPISYERAADVIGLEMQDAMGAYLAESHAADDPDRPVVRSADVDVSSFDATTIEWLSWAGRVWNAATLQESLALIGEGPAAEPDALETVMNDILERRNAHLESEVDAALADYEHVVVPWGALHLSAIESSLLRQGFEEVRSRYRRLISWSTILAAML
jgi:hypothetical protein